MIARKIGLNLIFVGHLDDIDDLKKWGRDAPLSDSDKNKVTLTNISNYIVNRLKETGKRSILFVSSPRIRCTETSHLLASEIRKQSEKSVKIRYSIDKNLRATDQGKFILPKDYRPGSFYKGLQLADKIFIKEWLNLSNFHYKYGDPVMNSDGSFRYPEIAHWFIESGESYAELLTRILKSVIELSDKSNKLNLNVEVVIVAHGFTYYILNGLVIVSELVKQGHLHLDPGDLAKNLWQINESHKIDWNLSPSALLDYSNLSDKKLMKILQKEIEYLSN